MATEFGVFIKKLILEKGIRQKDLANELKISESQLSNVLEGRSKYALDIGRLLKCQKYFALDKEKTIILFEKAFESSTDIIFEGKYLEKERQNMLKGILTTLLLFHDIDLYNKDYEDIKKSAKYIKEVISMENVEIRSPEARTPID
jgi:transcriptional regulator with XRE-family HTH domain